MRSQTARDPSRRTRGVRRGRRRFIQHGAPGGGTEGEQDAAVEMAEHTLELIGRIGLVRPAQSQPRTQPSPGRADPTLTHPARPTAQRAARNHRLTRAGKQRPFVGRLDPLAQHTDDGFQHRVDRRSPAPQAGGHQRGCRTVTELHPYNRHPLEPLARRQIPDPRAVPPTVGSSAARRPARRTDTPGLSKQDAQQVVPPVLDREEVVRQPRCEYTTNCLGRADTGPVGVQTSRPRVRTFPFQIKLCAAKRAAQLNPVRPASLIQSETGTPSELRTE